MDRQTSRQRPNAHRRARRAPEAPPPTPFRADAFTLGLPNGWADATIYTLAGPLADGLRHTLTVACAPHDGLSLDAFARAQTDDVLASLPASALLLRDRLTRADGAPAERAIFRWSPLAEQTLYHQQVYTLARGVGLTVATSFTRRSRQILGPEVLRIALSIAPP